MTTNTAHNARRTYKDAGLIIHHLQIKSATLASLQLATLVRHPIYMDNSKAPSFLKAQSHYKTSHSDVLFSGLNGQAAEIRLFRPPRVLKEVAVIHTALGNFTVPSQAENMGQLKLQLFDMNLASPYDIIGIYKGKARLMGDRRVCLSDEAVLPEEYEVEIVESEWHMPCKSSMSIST